MNWSPVSLALFLAAIVVLWFKPGVRKAPLFGVGLFLYGLLWLMWLGADYFTANGITEAVLFTLLNNLKGAGIGGYWKLLLASLLGMALMAAAVWVYARLTARRRPSAPGLKLPAWALLLGALVLNPAATDLARLATGAQQAAGGDAGAGPFSSHYRVLERGSRTGKPLNLVYIYLESVERTYLDDTLFPGLAPNLKQLQKEALDFSNIAQLSGSEYTIAGMVASQCGVPLFAPFAPNSGYGKLQFLPKAVCLGDALKQYGYYLSYMQGADLAFSGKGAFYQSHGFDELYGKTNLNELNPTPGQGAPQSVWGFYDDFLMERVWERFNHLSEKSSPFALMMLTLDTHHPHGLPTPSCQKDSLRYAPRNHPLLNAVTCADHLAGELVRKIRQSPHADNTMIVITSDHLTMHSDLHKELESRPRRNLFLVLHPQHAQGQVNDAPASTLDVGVTALNLLGLDVKYGLGRNITAEATLKSHDENLDKHTHAWRADILQLWGNAKLGRNIQIDTQNRTVQYGSESVRYPVLLKVADDNSVEPLFEFHSEKTLAQQLGSFAADDKFYWIGLCGPMRLLRSHAWPYDDTCVAKGRLGGPIQLDRYAKRRIKLHASPFPDEPTDAQVYEKTRSLLLHGRYEATPSEGMDLTLPAMPTFVRSLAGFSGTEFWGRWTDANLAPSATIELHEPLPPAFTLQVRARAFAHNSRKPMQFQIGGQTQDLGFTSLMSEARLRWQDVEHSNAIAITPFSPTAPDSLDGRGDTRKIALGMADLIILAPDELDKLDRIQSPKGWSLSQPHFAADLQALRGFSKAFEQGRWLDGVHDIPQAELIFWKPLPARFELEITARAENLKTPVTLQINAGHESHAIQLKSRSGKHVVRFDNAQGQQIDIIPPPQALEQSSGLGTTNRKSGVIISNITLKPL